MCPQIPRAKSCVPGIHFYHTHLGILIVLSVLSLALFSRQGIKKFYA
jgi:hypothetical protein